MPESMIYSQSFPSDLQESASIQQQILDVWVQHGISDGDLPDLQLALEEGFHRSHGDGALPPISTDRRIPGPRFPDPLLFSEVFMR